MIEEQPNPTNPQGMKVKSRPRRERSAPTDSRQNLFFSKRTYDLPMLRSFVAMFVFVMCVFDRSASAQACTHDEPSRSPTVANEAACLPLPEAPMPVVPSGGNDEAGPAQAATTGPQYSARSTPTGRLDTLIDPTEIPPKLSAADKVGMGLKASVSPFAVMGWVGSATYSESFNRSPNYGQSAKDYAQRLGAAAARASSEGIFSTSVMAPILHEDPRYFVEGPGHPSLHRALYALSRVLITKRDDGRSRINYALLSGNAIGAGLTQTYYPAGNRNFHGTVTTFGVSLAGSGVKFVLEEFFYKEASIVQWKGKF